jgi:hypothetical protein
MMGFMIAAINYDQFGHLGWIVAKPEVTQFPITVVKRRYQTSSDVANSNTVLCRMKSANAT